MPWMILSPRETESVYAPGAGSSAIVKLLQEKLDPLTGEITLSDEELEQVRRLAPKWRGPFQKALAAVLSAAERHNG
jgi:hypothetical protein